jgi:hypothetical protein
LILARKRGTVKRQAKKMLLFSEIDTH